MKFLVELTLFASTASRSQLLDRVHQLEDAVDGISLWDHMFCALDRPRRDAALKPCDPLTTLAAIAGMSDKLTLQSVVMNTAWAHPVLMLRQFNQLAVLVGGERVSAGLGPAGTNEEFDALGLPFPKFKQRMERLEETFQIARQLYDNGFANFKGQYLEANELPVSPVPRVPPRLLMGGGGSDRVLEIAGRYCDALDIHGDPRHGRMEGQNNTELHLTDVRRRALTTVTGLGQRVEMVRDVAGQAGRPRNAVGISVSAWYVTFGGKSVVDEAERHICEHRGHIPHQSLADNPYLLIGEPQQMADTLREREERMGLTQLILRDGDVERDDVDAVRFGKQVIPLFKYPATPLNDPRRSCGGAFQVCCCRRAPHLRCGGVPEPVGAC